MRDGHALCVKLTHPEMADWAGNLNKSLGMVLVHPNRFMNEHAA
jgi:hypothetical protein